MFGSLKENQLGPKGAAALADGLKGNATLTELKCVAIPRACQIRKATGAVRPASAADAGRLKLSTHTLFGSLAGNKLCGVDDSGRGTFTVEGINALFEGVKTSSVTSLKCACQIWVTCLTTSVSSR